MTSSAVALSVLTGSSFPHSAGSCTSFGTSMICGGPATTSGPLEQAGSVSRQNSTQAGPLRGRKGSFDLSGKVTA